MDWSVQISWGSHDFFRPESMLAVMKNLMVVVESHDGAVDNMFHDFRNN